MDLFVDPHLTLIFPNVTHFTFDQAAFDEHLLKGFLYFQRSTVPLLELLKEKSIFFQKYTCRLFDKNELKLLDYLQSSNKSYQKWALAALDRQKVIQAIMQVEYYDNERIEKEMRTLLLGTITCAILVFNQN